MQLSIFVTNFSITGSYFISGLKVGQMTRTIWVTWVTFFEGQVGLIHKLNYLDVTRMSHVL